MRPNNFLLIWLFILVDIFLITGLLSINLFPIFEDVSFISTVIIILYFLSNIMMVYLVMMPDNPYIDRMLKWVPDTLVGMGLLGTVVGFYYTFNGLFDGFNVEDKSTIEAILEQMGVGFPIALISSITGISTSMMVTFKMIWWKNNEK